MRFGEFLIKHKRVHRDWTLGLIKADAAAAEIACLRAEVPAIEPSEKRKTADFLLSRFESQLSPDAQDRMASAVNAISAAAVVDGSVRERIARAERGMTALTLIARRATNSSEEHAILSMNDTLMTLIDSLRNVQSSE